MIPVTPHCGKTKKTFGLREKKTKSNTSAIEMNLKGKALVAKSLLHGLSLRELLTFINDDYMHMNYDYLSQNHNVTDGENDKVNIEIPYVDGDPDLHRTHLYSFLHVYHVIVDALIGTFSSRYKDIKFLKRTLADFERKYVGLVRQVTQNNPTYEEICSSLGLWKLR